MSTSWIRVITHVVAVVGILSVHQLPIISGDLEPVLQRCCQSGEAWARNHTTCTGPPTESGSMPPQDRLTCLTSLYICCIRSHRRVDCERGKETAKEGRPCGSADSAFRDCCDGCSLGIQAGIMRMPCGFVRFSFGAPWDEAYIDCCEKSSSSQGVSHHTRKVICEPNNPCSQRCDIVENQVKCSCYPGFKLALDQATCEDVDECQLNTHTCNPTTEHCSNLVGGFKCLPNDQSKPDACPSGLIKNLQTQLCEDFDECALQPCPRHEVCVNTYGSYTCEYKSDTTNPLTDLCQPGFAYNDNNGLCLDVDECAENIHSCNRTIEICQNSHGSFQCLLKPARSRDCPAGFKWSDVTSNCEDFDECQEDLHDCDIDKNCRNTIGGYECEPKCFLLMKFDPVQNKCVDSNACADGLHDCKPDEACISTAEGLGYVCFPKSGDNPCPPGFKPTNGNNPTCEDINECEEFTDVCDVDGETCVNGQGSYDCVPNPNPTKSRPQLQTQSCPLGLQFDEERKQCVDIDECITNIDLCNRTTHDCVNRNGTYDCVAKHISTNYCPPGYSKNPITGACEDINECTEGRHKCLPDQELCVNVPGAYRCQQLTFHKVCPLGHRFDVLANSCTDVNECLEGTHTCNATTQNCVNAVGSYRCVTKANCPHGYRWSGNKCDDVNECTEFLDDCDRRTQYCVNTPGSYQCQTKTQHPVICGPGYIYDINRNSCTDVNECKDHPCEDDQICENTIGSYTCICPDGFYLHHLTKECRDINECQLGQHTCAESQRCDNTIGSFTCIRMTSCGTGYTLNAGTSQCEDDDECVLGTHNCGPGFSCRNIQGSFRCDRVKCPTGQKLLSDGSCKVVVCGKGMEPDDAGNCVDINECARNNVCRNNQRCINTVGSYRCQNLLNCSPGYELNEFGNQCVDVDECARRIYECGAQQTCRNRLGGYACECPKGYALNLQRECEDIDECTRFRGQVCSRMSECVNTIGSYVCNCKEGFRKADDDKNCLDVDECADSPNICQQVCNNVWGSYQCSCQAGFTLGPDNRSCQDIDECKTYEGHGDLCIGYCVNEPGSFSCSCPPGYRLSSDKRTCQDIDECQEQNVCSGDKQVCLNTRGGYKCNRIVCPPNYVRDKDHRNRCKKAVQECPFNDVECLNEPKSFSYNYITFVSLIRIPYSGQLDLFTMRGPRTSITTVEFNLQLKDARAPSGITLATREYFHLRRTAYNEAMVSLIKSIQGPQEIELDLILKMFHHGKFAGNAVAKIFIFVSEHKF